jgi:hypothetical protein
MASWLIVSRKSSRARIILLVRWMPGLPASCKATAATLTPYLGLGG